MSLQVKLALRVYPKLCGQTFMSNLKKRCLFLSSTFSKLGVCRASDCSERRGGVRLKYSAAVRPKLPPDDAYQMMLFHDAHLVEVLGCESIIFHDAFAGTFLIRDLLLSCTKSRVDHGRNAHRANLCLLLTSSSEPASLGNRHPSGLMPCVLSWHVCSRTVFFQSFHLTSPC